MLAEMLLLQKSLRLHEKVWSVHIHLLAMQGILSGYHISEKVSPKNRRKGEADLERRQREAAGGFTVAPKQADPASRT